MVFFLLLGLALPVQAATLSDSDRNPHNHGAIFGVDRVYELEKNATERATYPNLTKVQIEWSIQHRDAIGNNYASDFHLTTVFQNGTPNQTLVTRTSSNIDAFSNTTRDEYMNFFEPGTLLRLEVFGAYCADSADCINNITYPEDFTPSGVQFLFQVPFPSDAMGSVLGWNPASHPLGPGVSSLGVDPGTGLFVIGILLLVIPIAIISVLRKGNVTSQELAAYGFMAALANVALGLWHPIVFVFAALYLSWSFVDQVMGGEE